MNINWKTVKTILAFVVIVAVIAWTVDSIRTRSYSGINLNFGVQSGSVSVTNPSEAALPVQFVGSGSRVFRVLSTIEGVSGSSISEGTGSARTQLFAFDLPPGTSEFTISGGTAVNFTATTDTELEAVVNPVSQETARATVFAAVLVVAGSLYYASRLHEHTWIKRLRGKSAPTQDTVKPIEPASGVDDGGQGRAIRSYGDNRAQP